MLIQYSSGVGRCRYFTMRSVALFVLAILVSQTQCARILGIFPHTGKSHQMVFDPLLLKLAERGHDLTVVTFFPQKNPPANYTDISLEGIAPVGLEVLDVEYFFDTSNVYLKTLGIERLYNQVFIFSPLDEMALDICKGLLKRSSVKEALKKEYDLILIENFSSDCALGLIHVYGLNAPVVALSSTGVFPWLHNRIGLNNNPAYVPEMTTTFPPKMNFLQRLENTFLQLSYKVWFRYAIQLKEQEIIENHFGQKIPDLEELAKKVSLLLINTHHSLNGVKPTVPALVEVGGMHLSDSRKPISAYIERFINEAEEGVVLLSFGSLIRTASMPKYKEEMILNALSKLKQRVLWKHEDSDEEGTMVADNIMRVKWLPQYDLLRHPKVLAFVAHGGLLGMTEAISAGKPMVVIPFYGDQPSNGAHAKEAGFAEMIPYVELSEKALSDALEKVLSAEMRLNAKRASNIWRDRQAEPLDTAVYWVERVLRWGPHAPLHSAARDLNFIELSLLDVAATLLLAVIVVILALRFILSLISSLLGLKSKKEKIH